MTYTFDAALIATLADTIVTAALSEGYADQAILGDWSDYDLMGGDLEYLRGEHPDSPEEVRGLDEEALEALEELVSAEVEERISAAVTRRARELALSEPAPASVLLEAACRWLSGRDEDTLRGEVYELAARRLAAVVAAESEALAPGEALCWHEDAHREAFELDEDNGEVIGTYTEDLTDRDYLIARDDNGDLVWGRADNGGTCGAGDLLEWWITSLGHAEAIAEALRAKGTALHVLDLAGSRTKDRALYADRLTDGWTVVDPTGGRWWPADEARAEIEASPDAGAAALRICLATPERGEWCS